MDLIVIKRDGREVPFNKTKIKQAIIKAMKATGANYPDIARIIANDTENYFLKQEEEKITISQIEKYIFNRLCHYGQEITARAYENYRTIQEYRKQTMDTDEAILGLIRGTNKEAIMENSNKNAYNASTQRDLMAGEVSKSIVRRKILPPNFVQAHDNGIVHWHDMDYTIQSIHNCFSRDTKFITVEGLKSFNDFNDGDIIEVFGIDGKIHKAIVKNYGKQFLNEYIFYNGKKEHTHSVKATANHRWILKDNSETTNLKIGDKLIKAPIMYEHSLNWEELSFECKMAWCKGFGLGDGTVEYGSKDTEGKNIKSNRTKIRLCGNKDLQYLNRFEIEGCKIRNTHFENGDKEVVIYNYAKEIPSFSSIEEIKCFLNGLYCADGSVQKQGNKINYRLQSSKKEVIDFIRKYADTCGLYITKEKELTGQTTNFGIRPYTIYFSFNPDFSYSYTVLDIKKSVSEEEVWCLEVEDVHNFILEYGIPTGNCCLVNMKDILDNGTVINGHGIDSPHTFQTACNIATQVMAQVASGQYGGQTTSIAHLAPYVRKSYNKYIAEVIAEGKESGIKYTQKEIETIAMRRTRKEVQSGVQTIQYQINTLATSNGQSPFVSIYMDIYEDPEYEMEVAMIIEEILKQRILGMKNEAGVYIAPEFPKLLMVLRPEIVYENGKYNYLMPIIEECVAKRMVPDFISAKVMAENTGGYVYPCMGCRSFLSPWFPEGSDTPEFYGRANLGVVSLNLPDVALAAGGDIDTFWNILDERLNLCKEMILYRIGLLIGAKPEISPIHWKYGALARLSDEDTIDSLFHKFSCSLGYVGLCECVRALGYPSHTDEEGEKVALAIMQKLTDKCAEWKAETGYGFSVYGTPAESLIYKFARKTKERYGVIPGVTDKLYFTNSYHVHVTEPIDAFTKLKFESQFQKLSQGGCISYVEIPNLINNLPVIGELIKFIYENIQYAEINSKIDYCQVCGYDGQILIDENLEWYCPSCGNRDTKKMNVARRVCGYIGSNYFNLGKTEELSERVEHLD